CLIDYYYKKGIPAQFLTIIDESHVTIPQIGGMYEGDRSRKQTLVEYGFRLPSCLDNRPLKWKEFEDLIGQTIFVSATPGPYELKMSNQVVELIIRPTFLVDPPISVRSTKAQIDDLIAEIKKRVEKKQRVLVTTLTKRMAEDLADYLQELGIRVKYLHSEVETLERVEVLRDLRLGEFDCLVGINLLREGLDLPEVAMVAILDADKEGFLHSTRSLIQISGRTARNIDGEVIMYADRMTSAMKEAIKEMERRRNIQLEYNQKYGMAPESIYKTPQEIMQATKVAAFVKDKEVKYGESGRLDGDLPLRQSELLRFLNKEMARYAANLDFEKAANIRDEIQKRRNKWKLKKQ
ncbi:excinuclease ABC subunit B, partial [Candidatus Desantisbacteria bacterium CG07_land_8_20_14_0_80_39_15]